MNIFTSALNRCISAFQSRKQPNPTADILPSRFLVWLPSTANRRKHRIEEYLASLPYFYGTMLDDVDIQMQLLASAGDGFLIVCPRHENEKSNSHRKWLLVFLANNETVIKINIIYSKRKFVLAKEKDVTLQRFLEEQEMNTIERPFFLTSNQVVEQMAITPHLGFPIPKGVFRLGVLSQKTLLFDSDRRIPVFELDCSSLKTHFQQEIYDEARKLLTFGSTYIWRLWGIVYENSILRLVLEDIVYGSLAEYIRLGQRLESQLKRFSLQMAEGLRYLEKFNFIHFRLSIDCFLVTYCYNVKLAIYGFSENELIKKFEDFEDLDQCRWMPPECLPAIAIPNVVVPTDRARYSLTSMPYTFGTCLWSLFLSGAIPYENQPPENIRDRLFRLQNLPEVDEEFMPRDIIEITIQCWESKPNHRPNFKEIKQLLRKIQNTFHF
uniref:Protein kinase domain-containing protein n=1 Tax=Panagrolaimus sp. PS1159 TaxID=55785 RepID=A0AC35FM44_9BILA